MLCPQRLQWVDLSLPSSQGHFGQTLFSCHFLRPTGLVTYSLSVTELTCLESGQHSSDENEEKNPPKIET